jgi:hypothetical protein
VHSRILHAVLYDGVLFSTIAYSDVAEGVAFVPGTGLYVRALDGQ